MHYEIRLSEGMARVYAVTPQSGPVPMMEFAKVISDITRCDPIFLPHGGDESCACYARAEKDRKFYLLYLKPTQRHIIYDDLHGGVSNFVIVNPHTYIGVFLRGGAVQAGYAFVAREKIGRVGPLGILPVPNVDQVGRICEGDRAMWNVAADPGETAVSYARYFFESTFSPHINAHFSVLPNEIHPDSIRDPGTACRASFEMWENVSKTADVCSLDWTVQWTVEDVLRSHWGGGR